MTPFRSMEARPPAPIVPTRTHDRSTVWPVAVGFSATDSIGGDATPDQPDLRHRVPVLSRNGAAGSEATAATYTPAVSQSASTRAVLIPVKAFSDAKARLSDALDPAQRAQLAEEMATTVVRAAKPLEVWIVCDDTAVAEWATRLGANVLWKPGRGLNGAVNEGVADLAHLDIDTVIVAHADLPHAEQLEWLAASDGVTLVPDRHGDGTNVIVIPTESGFVFSYGPASFSRHQAEAARLGLAVNVVHDERLAWDVDRPEDLLTPAWATPR